MSTIRFDHTKNSHSEALDMDDDQMAALTNTLASISLHIVQDKPKKSEITEMLVQTLSYKELAMLATEALEHSTQKALESYHRYMKEGVDDITDDIKEGSNNEAISLRIDVEDIDGSLDKYNLPDDVKRQLKQQILDQMKNNFNPEEND